MRSRALHPLEPCPWARKLPSFKYGTCFYGSQRCVRAITKNSLAPVLILSCRVLVNLPLAEVNLPLADPAVKGRSQTGQAIVLQVLHTQLRRLGAKGRPDRLECHRSTWNMQDGPQGFRTFDKRTVGTVTSWPCLLALSATWDGTLAHEYGAAIGREFKTSMLRAQTLDLRRSVAQLLSCDQRRVVTCG